MTRALGERPRLLLHSGTVYRVRTLDGKEHVADWDDARREFLRPHEKHQRGPAVISMDLIGAVTLARHRGSRPRWYPLDDCYRASVCSPTTTTPQRAS